MYNKDYFDWQAQYGDFGSIVDQEKFINYLGPKKKVIEFGCGGGYLLSKLPAKIKIGIEINPEARKKARSNGIKVLNSSKQISDNWADLIISNHALEHCIHPFTEIKNLYKKLRKNGIIVFVTPHERNSKYSNNDINQHLYTWSEQNIANLFTLAGYKLISVETRKTAWPPFYRQIYSITGKRMFNNISNIYGRLFAPMWEIRLVAKK